MSEKAITREEQFLSAIAGDSTANIKPITRKEMFLAKAAGQSVPDIKPITREEFLLKKIADNGTSGGSGGGGTEALDEVLKALYDGTEYELNSNVEGKVGKVSGYGNVTKINLPNVTSIGESVFFGCISLTSINLPNATIIGERAFHNCTSLTSIDLPKVTHIGSAVFDGTNLSTLVLRTTSQICSLNVTAVLGTKILTVEGMPTGEGFVYVPTALYEDYVANLTVQATALTGDAATAEYIVRAVLRKIEDYPEITG